LHAFWKMLETEAVDPLNRIGVNKGG
jgi:hypothetical protein